MAPKRKSNGPGEVESQEGVANPEEFTNPVYLVTERDDEESVYSIIKIDAAAGGNEPHRARTVAGLPGTERGMSFVTAHSEHGSWIIGVGGGLKAGTIIFKPDTLQVYHGPRLANPKHRPVLIWHDSGEVYAISRRPRLVHRIDAEPWFQSLSFKNGVPSKELGVYASWSFLPPPPFFPSLVDPFEFRNPPEISVTSYAAVGSYILISAQVLSRQQQEQLTTTTGTYAFHVVNKTWDKVHDNNLPFVGQAVPLDGSNLFAARPVSSSSSNGGAASVFHMSIKAPMAAPLLSVQEFPVAAAGDKIPCPLICPLGNDSFCFIRLGSVRRSRRKSNGLKEIQVILLTFNVQKQSIKAISTACQSHGAEGDDLIPTLVKEQSYTYKIKDQSQRLLDSDMPLVAALYMDTLGRELFDGERIDMKATRDIRGKVFEAPVR